MCRVMSIPLTLLGALSGRPTRRRLFGPVAHEELERDLQDRLEGDLEDASRRWGFDFKADVPLEGSDFQWEAVPGTKMPAVYRTRTDGTRDGQKGTSNTDGHRVTGPGLEGAKESTQRHTVKRKQTNITDYYQSKRRAVAVPRKSGQ